MAKKKRNRSVQKPKPRNIVAKNAQTSGAGFHEPKVGRTTNRQQQKKDWKKEQDVLLPPIYSSHNTLVID